ncbi:MAG: RNA polymerase sigma factor [Candidatus Aminicenantes bacterium]|nr:MAG: RNA polymerase sigma factor [Candidatus Aminicenantes bacterium]
MDDKSIVSRCLMGDEEVFELVVKRYEIQLLHFTWHILGDEDEAKDVTQDAFVRAYFHLHSYDANRSFKTWLFTIAYNRCMDKIREKQTRTRFIKKMGNEQRLARHRDNPEKRLEDSEQSLLILSKLNKKERTAMTLKWNEGYLSREIAEILGCKESTVRVYILNAKRKLKKFLEKK